MAGSITLSSFCGLSPPCFAGMHARGAGTSACVRSHVFYAVIVVFVVEISVAVVSVAAAPKIVLGGRPASKLGPVYSLDSAF